MNNKKRIYLLWFLSCVLHFPPDEQGEFFWYRVDTLFPHLEKGYGWCLIFQFDEFFHKRHHQPYPQATIFEQQTNEYSGKLQIKTISPAFGYLRLMRVVMLST